jgi:hypothetical protein
VFRFPNLVIPQENSFCQKCLTQSQSSVTKLLFSFNLSKAPRVGLEPQQLLCPSCDPIWKAIDHPSLLIHRQPRVGPPPSAASSVRIYDHQQRSSNSSSSSYHQPLHNITNSSSGIIADSSSFVKQHPSLAKAPVPPPITNRSTKMDVVDLYDDELEEDTYNYGRDIPAKQPVNSKSTYPSSNSSSSTKNSSSSFSAQTVEDNPQCNCGLSSVVRLSRKDNENKGRSFYTCSKGM